VFQLDEGLDTGPIYGTLVEPIKPADTAGDLLDRLAAAGATLLVRVVDGIEAAALSPVDQPTGEVSLAPKIGVADARVRWTDPAFAVDRRVRATTPEPGAWTTFRGQRIKLGPVRTAERAAVLGPTASEQLEPGQLRVSPADVLVGTATDAVRLGQVQAPGKKAMPAADWARGSRVAVREGFV
jgi:methionyl-tRNA formyltransferase